MKYYCTIFFFSLSGLLFAQKEADTLKNNNQIYRKWSGWRMNDQRINWKGVKSNIQQVPEAVPSLQKAVINMRMFYLSVTTFIASIMLIKDRAFPQIPSTRNTVHYLTSFLSTGAMIYFGLKSAKHQNKAVRIHNEKRMTAY